MHLKVVDARRFVKMPLSSLAGIFIVVVVTYQGSCCDLWGRQCDQLLLSGD